MKTRLLSLLLSAPLVIAAGGCWLKIAMSKAHGLGWQDGS